MSVKKTKPTRDELIDLYQQPGVSISEIARRYDTSQPTVRKWLIEYVIPRKSQKEVSREVNAAKRPAIPLRDQFENDFHSLSVDELEEKYKTGQATLYQWRNAFGLEPKSHSQSCILGKAKQFQHIRYSAEAVSTAYNETCSLSIAAEKLGISYGYMRFLCKQYGIEIINPKRSKQENHLYETCVNLAPKDRWKIGDRSVITPFELDIYNIDKGLAIEYCGSYWHSETYGKKDRNYHARKLQLCREKGVKLITVFEFDDMEKITDLLRTLLGISSPLNARETVVFDVEPSAAAAFYQRHHLSGSVGASTHLGLMCKKTNDVVMMASFGKARNGKHTYECMRMASDGLYRVRGGASKLFRHFDRRMNVGDTLITYADLRFGEGNTYLHCGFKRVADTKPNYWYFHKNTPHIKHSRVAFQKHKLPNLLNRYDNSRSEYQNMLMNGYDRIWDCGNAVYIKEKGSV